jgi:hypothetical protein
MEVDLRYADLWLGLVDASVVALAESLDVRRLATRDVRHFAAVRLRNRSFELVVDPTDADTSRVEDHPLATRFLPKRLTERKRNDLVLEAAVNGKAEAIVAHTVRDFD